MPTPNLFPVLTIYPYVSIHSNSNSNSRPSQLGLQTPASVMKRRSPLRSESINRYYFTSLCVITASACFPPQRWQHTSTRVRETLQLQLRLHRQEQQRAFSAAGRDTRGSEVKMTQYADVESIHWWSISFHNPRGLRCIIWVCCMSEKAENLALGLNSYE